MKNLLLSAVLICTVALVAGCAMTASGPDGAVEQDAQTTSSPSENTTENTNSADAGQAGGERTTDASGEAGIAATSPDGTPNGDATGNANASASGGPNVPEGRVLLRFQGDEGTEFSGRCTAGGEEEEVSGSVPDRMTFRLSEGSLDCTLSNDGDGVLRVLLDSGNDRSVYEISASGGEISFSHSASGSSSSVTSSNSSGSSSQSSSVTSSGNSSSSSSSSSVVVQQNSQ